MAVRDIFKISFRTFFNPSAWIGWEGLKGFNKYFYAFFSSQFNVKVTQDPSRAETFSDAMHRLGVSEEELSDIASAYQAYSWFFLTLSLCAVGFSFYLLAKHFSIAGFILGLCVVFLLLAQAFRYDFWFLQVKHRKLGMTFQEWKQRKPHTGEGGAL